MDLRLALVCISTTALLTAACSSGSSNGDDDNGGGSQGASGGTGGASSGGSSGGGAAANGGSAQPGGQGGTGAGTGGAPPTNGGTGTGGSATGGTGTGGSGTGGSTSGASGSGPAGASGSGPAGAAGLGSGGGAGAAAGAAGAAGSTTGGDGLGNGMMTGMGRSMEQYETTEVGRNGVPYELITNGWGPGFTSHTVSWNGTSFIVEAMEGSRGSGGQPASYPSVFCGKYSVAQVPACGLPKAMDQITSLKTGWRWAANGNTGPYNAAYDIWLGTSTGFGMYLMVWLRDPPGEQPAGSKSMFTGITVANAPGVWDIWSGTVNNRPIINWVRQEGMDSSEIEFDVMDFIRDAQMRNLTITGTQVNAVAVGFEIWSGPITNLESKDFYVDVK
ncbi:MAG TPA: hypothetical protein VNN72_21455 [Polyangiaceae bacterium]|nr:hypothetical protein [Polyangiaceae bacterium]